ncbi:hypothetical protein [Fusobacterium mortiferum]|uniref:Uncharacterized protein n=1 Tax=Fusobacterium mortiferum ATCC 9817 TaxID=469616 RepID=A0ABN5JE63_FUSMR|nr:hypothetical protein [Fusobacterium mortiferum]AVQ18873.1 hypothetical protein C4N19_07110 [Fusobacterium mortiferum ATCC 9817]EEO35119.1 hypothetical protein FMAG_00681 [Fusobacterium mortiferum ATCC 9817]
MEGEYSILLRHKGAKGIRKLVSKELKSTYDFIRSMKYRVTDLKDLSIGEVTFIRERCHNLKLGSFDELIQVLELGISYDERGALSGRKNDYKILKVCNNCYYCECIGELKLCGNKNSIKYNEEINIAGICGCFEKGIYWRKLGNE